MSKRVFIGMQIAIIWLTSTIFLPGGEELAAENEGRKMGDKRPLRAEGADKWLSSKDFDALWLLKPMLQRSGGSRLADDETVLFLSNRNRRRYPVLFLRVSGKDAVLKRIKCDWFYNDEKFHTPEEMYKLLYEVEVETFKIPDSRVSELFCGISEWIGANPSPQNSHDIDGNALAAGELELWVLNSNSWVRINYAEFGTLLGDLISLAALMNNGKFDEWGQPGMKRMVESVIARAKTNFGKKEQIHRLPFLQKELTSWEIENEMELFPNLIPLEWLALSHREVDFSLTERGDSSNPNN